MKLSYKEKYEILLNEFREYKLICNRNEIVELLNNLKTDAEMALNGDWDCTTEEGIETGFSAQISLIDNVLDKLK